MPYKSSAGTQRLLGGARVCYYQVRNAFLLAERTEWRCGRRASIGTVRWQVRSYVTIRRLIHPMRLPAVIPGVLVGLHLFVRVKALGTPAVQKEPDHV